MNSLSSAGMTGGDRDVPLHERVPLSAIKENVLGIIMNFLSLCVNVGNSFQFFHNTMYDVIHSLLSYQERVRNQTT